MIREVASHADDLARPSYWRQHRHAILLDDLILSAFNTILDGGLYFLLAVASLKELYKRLSSVP